MRDANQTLTTNLKYIKEAIESEYDTAKEQKNNLINELGCVKRQDSKGSILLESAASDSAKMAPGQSHLMKLEKISRQVHSMIQAKKPLECILALIESCR